MKVLIALTHLNKGGIAFYTVNLARHLKRSGIDTVVLSSGGDLEDILHKNGIPHIKAAIKTKSEFGFKVWRALPGIISRTREGGFDLIHAQTRVTQVASEVVSRVLGVPYVTTCHGFFNHRKLSRKILPCWGDNVIAISKSVRDHLIFDMKVPEEKVKLVYNGIDLDLYKGAFKEKKNEILKETGIEEGSTIIGSVGRFSSVKGFKYLIEAFDKASGKMGNISLLVVGQGPEETELLKQVSRVSSSKRIFFSQGKKPLGEYLSAMDIFCMPSLSEGFGLAVVEAMASGKPCIASSVGGITEIITNEKDGLLVAPASSDEIGKAITRLLRDPELMERLSLAAKKRAGDFSLKKNAEETVKVYESVLASRSK